MAFDLLFFVGPVAHPFDDHAHAENEQQREGDPVVPFHDVLAGEQADGPTDERGDRFHHAEDQAGADRFAKTGLMQAGAFAD